MKRERERERENNLFCRDSSIQNKVSNNNKKKSHQPKVEMQEKKKHQKLKFFKERLRE